MNTTKLMETAKSVRSFNRFYTRQIGLLQQGLLDSSFSLSEARVIYEIAQKSGITATELGSELNLDAGYLSRMIRNFTNKGLVLKETSMTDGRQRHLKLSESGKQAFALLDSHSQQEIEAMLSLLSPQNQERLVTAMRNIEYLLGGRAEHKAPYLLRPPQPGDAGLGGGTAWCVVRARIPVGLDF